MSNPPDRKPAVRFIFVTLVLSIVGFGLLIPVLPKLIVQFEGGDFTSGANTLKWIVGIYAFMQFVSSPILGSLSDRFGRRPIILIATAGSAIDYLIMANAPTLVWFFIARMIAGSTAGVLATANAYIADVTPPEKRAQSFGLLGAAFGIGFIIGPVVGGGSVWFGHFLGTWLAPTSPNLAAWFAEHALKLPFFLAAICSAANWIYGYFVLPESLKLENRREFSWKRSNPVGAFLAMRRFPAVVGLVECYFILTLAQVMLQTTWALYTEERYGWNPLQIGLSLMFVGVATGVVQATLVKKIVPKLGDTRAVIVGMGVSIVAYVGYGLASHGWALYAVICVGCFVQGIFAGLQSLASIPGPFIALYSFGWAIAPERRFHLPGIAFFEAALLTVLALVLAIRSFKRDETAGNAVPVAAPGV